MNTPYSLIALCACVLSVGACNKTPTAPLTPMVDQPVPMAYDTAASAVVDPSLPTTEVAFPLGIASSPDATPGRPDGTRDPAQESAGQRIPGQNNDHSAPIAPSAKPGSAP